MFTCRPNLFVLRAARNETKKPRTHPETLESERAGVYLAGVIVAGMHTNEIFIENGRFHGRQIAAGIAAKFSTSHAD